MKRAVIPVHGWARSVGDVEKWARRGLRRDLINCRRWKDDYVAEFAWKAGSFSFPRSVRKARTTAAEHLGKAILNLNARGYERIDLVAHSLGVRVVWNGLLNLPWEKRSLVGDVFLFAGAIQAFRSWWGVATAIQGRVFNFSSTTDHTLSALYQANLGGGAGRPAGAALSTTCSHSHRGIHTRLRDVHNIRRPGVDHRSYRIPHCIDVVAAGEAKRRKGGHGDWRDDFWWQGNPAFPISRKTWKIRGALTEIIQRALASVYPYSAPRLTGAHIDGAPGPKTRRVLKRYQRNAKGLKVDGIVGQRTWDSLVGKPARFYQSTTKRILGMPLPW